jgi:adenylate cyclase
MHERLRDVNRQLAELDLPQLRLGVGVTRGLLVRGNIGSRERMQYTVIGDCVNLVSRLEGLCKELGAGIVVDHAVWQHLPPALQAQFPERGLFAVKGRTETVRVHAG